MTFSGNALCYLIAEILAHTFGIIVVDDGARAIPIGLLQGRSHFFHNFLIGILSNSHIKLLSE
jgi:hypothetical protein